MKKYRKIAQCQRLSKTLATGGQQIRHFWELYLGPGCFLA
ncbi:hypothetical protein AO368_0876 [Moraxella catarrhalis]|nr:hypothetical protein AO368_0876 [Moraxella catarrhalis]